MLARYRMVRGKRAADDPLPSGVRIDVRKHTRHVLAPEADMVEALLQDRSDPARLKAFAREYEALLTRRGRTNVEAFDELAALARANDVYIGCSCPTASQPDVMRCHTVLALRFMQTRYPDLDVHMPDDVSF